MPGAPTHDPVALTLPDGRQIVVLRKNARRLDRDGEYWSGRIQDSVDGHAAFVARGDILVGTLELEGRTYLLQPQRGGTHTLDEMRSGARTVCGGPKMRSGAAAFVGGSVALVAPSSSSMSSGPSLTPPTTGPIIDLLVVYTPDARVNAGGDEGIAATIDLAVEATNEALTNSRVPGAVRLVARREVAYAESRSMDRDLDHLTDERDGLLDEVHALRDAVGADLVSLIVDRNDHGYDGLAWVMQQPDANFASLGFNVVLRRTVASYTLAHEIGHNLGLSHDRANAPAPGAFPYAYGYRDPPHFRDVMSYACSGAPCPLIAHYSNPDVQYAGRPTGRIGAEDNARALRVTMPVAALFRGATAPTLTSVAPTTVPTLGGVRITLRGARLSGVTTVTVGALEASDLLVIAPDTLSVVVPRAPQGRATVTLGDADRHETVLRDALTYVPSAADQDGDGLESEWEVAMGLDPADAVGSQGASGDPDSDSVTNLAERTHHGHPRGSSSVLFAEGASSDFFSTQFALFNPGPTTTGAVVRFIRADGAIRSTWLAVPGRTRRTIAVSAVAGMAQAEFSTIVESDAFLVADRTMTWGASGYGAHAETGIARPAPTWYLAEGSTVGGFSLFYLLQNPGVTPALVRVRYLRPAGPPLEKTYTLPPTSRTTLWVNQEQFEGIGAALSSTDVSAVLDVVQGPPIIVERSMYLTLPGQMFGAGHESSGVTAPASEWFFAEGATGPYFDQFLLVANPSTAATHIEVTYLLPDGHTVTKGHQVAANSRYTIWVDQEDAQLADTAVSTWVRAIDDVPVIVERAMWWPGAWPTWHEAHHSAGATATGTRWALAEGEVGGPHDVNTYALVANTSLAGAQVQVTLFFEDGGSAARTFFVGARSRFNVDTGAAFPGAMGRRFATLVESVGQAPAQLVVERGMYWNAAGQRWAAGTSSLGTRLP